MVFLHLPLLILITMAAFMILSLLCHLIKLSEFNLAALSNIDDWILCLHLIYSVWNSEVFKIKWKIYIMK